MKREPREKIKDEDLLVPLDIYKLGSEEDPCFGKHYDLKATECSICGDADFCAIVTAQNLHKKRGDIESKNRFKDLEEAEYVMGEKEKKARKYIKEKKSEGYNKLMIIIRCSKKFNLPKDKVKDIYNQLNS